MTTYNNTQVNTAAAAVPGPYGPFTRVTDMATLQTPNDMSKIQFTDNNGKTVYMIYAELTTPALRNARIAEFYGFEYVLHALINQIAAINTTLQAMKHADASGYTAQNFEDAVKLMRGVKIDSGYL